MWWTATGHARLSIHITRGGPSGNAYLTRDGFIVRHKQNDLYSNFGVAKRGLEL